MTLRVIRNPDVAPGTAVPVPANVARVHAELGLDVTTELHELPEVAARVGVGRVFLKDESGRGTLAAFKILGASWASFRVLCEQFSLDPGSASVADLSAAARSAATVPTLVTATDGNHGRAVAHAARVFGVRACITVPRGTSPGRIAAVEAEGAECRIIDGDYDAAVAAAAALTDDDHIVVSDTSWRGYEVVPRWVTEGYDTIYSEIDTQLADIGCGPPDAVLIPVGVGALAVAAVHHYGAASPYPATAAPGPVLVGVEPHGADCLGRSIRNGEMTAALGPHESMMVGLNCGNVSPIAWPVLRRGIHWSLVVDDAPVAEAMRLLASQGVTSGETGAAALGALIDWSAQLEPMPLADDAIVVVLSTEGATDPATYRAALQHPRATEPA